MCSSDLLVFREEVINDYPEEVRAFHKAYNQAVATLNESPDLTREVVVHAFNLEPAIKDYIVVPTFYPTRLPCEGYVEEIQKWTEAIQETTFDLEYDDLVSYIAITS